MCFGCSKEPSHRDGSFEYLQHMFWLRNKKNDFFCYALLSGGLVCECTESVPAQRCGIVRLILGHEERGG